MIGRYRGMECEHIIREGIMKTIIHKNSIKFLFLKQLGVFGLPLCLLGYLCAFWATFLRTCQLFTKLSA